VSDSCDDKQKKQTMNQSSKIINVLLIEDDPGDADLLREILSEEKKLSFHVEHVDKLQTGLERLAHGGTDVVLSDLSLPDSQGIETFIQVHDQASSVPIVVLTGFDDDTVALEAVRKGAQDYLVKGQVDGKMLARVIRYAIERKRVQEALLQKKREVEARERELREAQAMLVQAGKLRALGQLGAGIAHELNQPLAAVRGYAQVMLEQISSDDPHWKNLKIIEEQTGRMTQIVNNIRTFARDSKTALESIDIRKPIEDAFMLFTVQLKNHSIEVVREYEEGLPKVMGDPNQLQQVLINLIANARDALDTKGGGTIWVMARKKQETVKQSPQETRNKKLEIEVLFRDNGPGIPADVVDYIFDPFFTTKEPGQGTGLGLSISYGIMRHHQGGIAVTNRKDKGVEFVITLPAVAS